MLGRVLVGTFFVIAGVQKFMGIDGVAGYIASVGLPMSVPLAWLAGIIVTVAGAMLILNYQPKYASIVLAAYVVVVTAIFHGPQVWPAELGMFTKNLAVLGGLLFMAAKLPMPAKHPAMGADPMARMSV